MCLDNPGNYLRIGPLRLGECATYGCFLELTVQLVIILIGKQIFQNVLEIGVPIVKNLWKKCRTSLDDDGVSTRWEKDYILNQEVRRVMF